LRERKKETDPTECTDPHSPDFATSRVLKPRARRGRKKARKKRKQTKQNDMHARTSTEIPARTEQPATLKNYFCNNNAGSVQAGVAATFLKIWNASAL
jgi:hypothetical protein